MKSKLELIVTGILMIISIIGIFWKEIKKK